MKARRKYRDRDEIEVAVLDALVDRRDFGMTVFELRSRVEVDIEELEVALKNLHDDDLVTLDKHDGRSVIRPDERVVPSDQEDAGSPSILGRLMRRLLRPVRPYLRRLF